MAEVQSSNLFKNLIVICSSLILTVIAIGGIVLACGSIVGDVDNNKRVNIKQDATLEIHGREIVQGKLNDQKQAQTATNTLNVLTTLSSQIGTIVKTQNTLTTNVALIKQYQENSKENK